VTPDELHQILSGYNETCGESATMGDLEDLTGCAGTELAAALDQLVAGRRAIPHFAFGALSHVSAEACNGGQREMDAAELAVRIASLHGVSWLNTTEEARYRFIAAAQVALDYVFSIS